MLLKRKNSLSDVFDAYSEGEGDQALWPEDDVLPPAVEPSGYRPAPAGFNDAPASDITELDASAPAWDITELDAATSELTELDASVVTELDATTSDITELDAPASAVPTPRQSRWPLDEPDDGSPLPVVTAATEPTQRGLGIPPPPSSRAIAWFEQLPSLASAAPLSPEAFTGRHSTGSRAKEPPTEPSENERITVRAPPDRAGGMFRGRRRTVAVVFLAGSALLAGLALRRATLRGSSSSTPPVPARMAAMNVVPAFAVEKDRSVPRGGATDLQAPIGESVPASQAPSGGGSESAAADVKRESRRSRSAKESRREKARRKSHDSARARSSGVTTGALGSNIDLPPVEAKAPEHREVLSLPPR